MHEVSSTVGYLIRRSIAMNTYPRATKNRISVSDTSIHAPQNFFKAVGINFLMLLVLFLALFPYPFGSLFEQTSHVHNSNALFVDYDGGILGNSVRDAYATLEGNSFPHPDGTLIQPGWVDRKVEFGPTNKGIIVQLLSNVYGNLDDITDEEFQAEVERVMQLATEFAHEVPEHEFYQGEICFH